MNTSDPLPPKGDSLMTPDQLARASAALDAWYADGSPVGPADRRVYGKTELESMHAALEAPDTDAAMETFPGPSGSWLSSPEQDAENRQLMTQMRQHLGREPGSEAQAGRDAEAAARPR